MTDAEKRDQEVFEMCERRGWTLESPEDARTTIIVPMRRPRSAGDDEAVRSDAPAPTQEA